MKKWILCMALASFCVISLQAAQITKYAFEQNLLDTASGGTVADNLAGMKNYPGNGAYGDSAFWQDPTYEPGISGYAVRIGATGTYTYLPGHEADYPWADGYIAPESGASYLSTTNDSIDLSLTGGVFTMDGYFKADSVDYAYVRLFTKWVSGFTQSYHFTIHNGALEIIQKNISGANVTVTDDQTLAALGVQAGQWFHTAVTGDGSTLTLWLNRTAVITGTYNGTMFDSTSPFWIGGRADSYNPITSNNAFKGLVDEVTVWDEVKDAAYMASCAAIAEQVNINDRKAKLPSPISSAMNISPSGLVLDWSSGGTAPTYNLYMGTDAASLASVATGLTDSTYATAALLQNTKYYWRIDVVDNSITYTGDVWNFTTRYAILSATPANNTVKANPMTLDLSWTSIGTNPTYAIYFGMDAENLPLLATQSQQSYTLSNLTTKTVYYWRVDVIIGTDTFAGQVMKFTSGGKVTLAYPGNGGFNVDNDAVFQWVGDTGYVTAYDVYFGTDANSIAAATTASAEYKGRFLHPIQTWQFTSSMTYDARYYWRVDELADLTPIAKGDVMGFKVRSPVSTALYWPLDGNANDATTNGNNGEPWGSITWPTGLLNSCASIDAASADIIRYGAANLPYDANDCWSMNMFINVSQELKPLGIIGGFGSTANLAQPQAQARYFMYYDLDDSLRDPDNIAHMYFWTGRGWLDVEGNRNVALNKWQMLTATYDAYAKTTKLYLNGRLIGSRQYYPNLTSISSAYQDVMLAPANIWNTNEFTGKIDEFKIFFSTMNGMEVNAMLPWAHSPAPADSVTGVSLNPTLSWEGNSAATSYTLKYGDANDINGNIVNPTVVSGLTSPSYTLSNLVLGKTYYWSVDSVVTGYGSVPANEVWSFTTGANCVTPPASDLTNDCKVNLDDLTQMASEWLDNGLEDEGCTSQPASDINGDCKVNLLDFAQMALDWLSCGWDISAACL